ncbi:MAG TPA: hypothetical protein VIL34_12210 [Actinopolymorphaceae bacterium]
MIWAELEAIADRRLAERRIAQEQHIRKLHERLVSDGYHAQVLDQPREGWQVRVQYPPSTSVWVTVRCVITEGRATFEWCRWLPWTCSANDIDTAVAFLRDLLGAPSPRPAVAG